MKKLLYIFLFFVFFVLFRFSLISQNPEVKRTMHWYFGGQAGIDFSSGTAVADTNGKMGVYAGCSVISDTAGNLLFYTDGVTVWNKNHDTMQNGFGLYGGGTPYQGSVIVPQPQNDSIYFIFHQPDGGLDLYGLNYSIVNVKHNSGLGEITTKNIPLFKPNTEQLCAVHHANKCDIWVMGHEYHTNNWHAFLVTANGIDTTPITTIIGNQIPDSFLLNYPALQGFGSRFSSNGKKMASSMFWDNLQNTAYFDTLELYDFDNLTGVLSNRIVIPHSTITSFNFSPNNTKLYIYEWHSAIDSIWQGTAFVWQYDITSNTQSGIMATESVILQYGDRDWDYMDFQITPDKKIFVGRTFANNLIPDTLAVINNPNASGTLCNLVDKTFYLNGRIANVALPNFIQSYFGEDTTGCYPTSIEEISQELNNGILVYPNPFSEYAILRIANFDKLRIRHLELRIYDVLGKEVLRSIINEQSTIINRKNLLNGIYFLKIQAEQKVFTHKLIITN